MSQAMGGAWSVAVSQAGGEAGMPSKARASQCKREGVEGSPAESEWRALLRPPRLPHLSRPHRHPLRYGRGRLGQVQLLEAASKALLLRPRLRHQTR
jgi:hypothetical protein